MSHPSEPHQPIIHMFQPFQHAEHDIQSEPLPQELILPNLFQCFVDTVEGKKKLLHNQKAAKIYCKCSLDLQYYKELLDLCNDYLKSNPTLQSSTSDLSPQNHCTEVKEHSVMENDSTITKPLPNVKENNSSIPSVNKLFHPAKKV